MPGNDHTHNIHNKRKLSMKLYNRAAYSENDAFYANLLNALLTITTRLTHTHTHTHAQLLATTDIRLSTLVC